jgi:hypothetical protein
MADPTPLSDDELVSAYIDGELTADERARVESDPDLLAILRLMNPVVAATRAPVAPLSPDASARLIGRALDAISTEAPETADAAMAPVVDLTARRARRNQMLTRVGAVAAGVLVVALAGAAIRAGTDSSTSDETASVSAEDASDEVQDRSSGDDAGDAASEESGTDAMAAEMAPAAEGDEAVSADGADAEAAGGVDEDSADDAARFIPPSIPGLTPDLGPQEPTSLALFIDDNLATLAQAPPVAEGPRCFVPGFEEAGFAVVWWAEAGWDGRPAHVVVWRSETETLIVVHEGSGAEPGFSEPCEAIYQLAR